MRGLWPLVMLVGQGVWAANWSATLESKFQVDNRIEDRPNLSGEVWGDTHFFSNADKLGIHVTAVGRLSQSAVDSGVQLYQGYLEKAFSEVPLYLKLGRFQRADASGFYALDGGVIKYRLGRRWGIEGYAGVPRRFDLLRAVSGGSVVGAAASYRHRIDFGDENVSLTRLHWQVGVQRYRDDQNAWRLLSSWTGQGKALRRPYFLGAALLYRLDQTAFESLNLHTTLDVTSNLRWRNDYEFYQPLARFLTFRERFLSAYALEEQSLFRSELHHRPHPKWQYFISGRRATRGDGGDGYGLRAGAEFQLSNLRWAVVYDHLSLGQDTADSGYAGVSLAFNSRWEGHCNAAVRREEKALYGENWVRGGEIGTQFMLGPVGVILSLFYIANLRMRDDYVGAVRVVYHLDRFQPKAQSLACTLFC